MHIRAGAIRTWQSTLARRTRIFALSRAEALPDRPKAGQDATGAALAEPRHARLTSTLAGAFASPANRLAAILLAVAALYRLLLIVRGWPALDSDEAIIGLMARHILHGQFDYWFWGQQYMGAFQAYVVAGVFAVLGSSAFTLHLSMLLFTLGFLAAMYALGRAAYSPAVGLLTLAWLAVGPPVSVLRELTAIGGYQDILLFGALILLGVWSRLRQPARLPRGRAEWRRALLVYAGIGLASGIGLWSDLLILPVLLLAACALFAVRTREIFSVCGLVLVVAFFCGGFPYISYNITNKNATYKEIVRQTHPDGTSSQATLPAPGDWLNQIGETFSVAVPAVLASPHVCVNQGAVWPAYPPAEAEANHNPPGACDAANLAFSLAAVFLYLTVEWQLALVFRRWLAYRAAQASSSDALLSVARRVRGYVSAVAARSRRSHASSASSHTASPGADSSGFALAPDDTARLWLRLMLLGVAAMTLALYTTNQDAQRFQFTSSRYLLPLYLTTPLLLGSLWEFAAPRLRPFLAAGSRRAFATLPYLGAYVPAPGAGESALPPHRRGKGLEKRVPIARRHATDQGARSTLAALALFALLATSIGGGILTLAYSFDGQRFALPEPPLDRDVISFLDAHHIGAYYSDYWMCYRIMFETSERITCAVRGQNGEVGLELINNRNDAYIRAVSRVPYPAYILPAGTMQDHYFTLEVTAEHLPHDGYRRVVLDGYAIYYHP